ncbi:MAG: 50S ribosomal protein L19 [Candidatus Pacebacteria bacterium]|nr:50S ribosomal protein L19 [Candidatus Paceibacterota bacterium]
MNTIQKINRENMNMDLPAFTVGDSVRADIRIVEGGKERIQSFTGTVIARSGNGVSESITLRRVAYGIGIERVLTLHSPRLAKLEVVRRGNVKRAKLYWLRERQGKASRVKELRENKQ